MASYLRWIRGSKATKEDLFQKPRSRSLDPKALEASGIKQFLNNINNNNHHLHNNVVITAASAGVS